MEQKYTLAIKIKYPSGGFPLTKIYELLGVDNECKFMSKITINGVYIIPLDDETMKKIVLNIPNSIILGYIPVYDLIDRVMKNIRRCKHVLIRSRSPAINGLKDLEKIVGNNSNCLISFNVKRTSLGELIELKLNIEEIDQDTIQKIAHITIYGIGEKRDLGYGSIDTICIDE